MICKAQGCWASVLEHTTTKETRKTQMKSSPTATMKRQQVTQKKHKAKGLLAPESCLRKS